MEKATEFINSDKMREMMTETVAYIVNRNPIIGM